MLALLAATAPIHIGAALDPGKALEVVIDHGAVSLRAQPHLAGVARGVRVSLRAPELPHAFARALARLALDR